eukprot:TRINITY_DN6850_c0_g1_i2.p1 TRINITY_DN6850_c0_g1~~TRINITY_DN6850_c0_g1_i2.p1  ORF type:complete len:1044 (+),score=328.57 TRINITY_DN6850_c0_g1_i2:146-3277(+)
METASTSEEPPTYNAYVSNADHPVYSAWVSKKPGSFLDIPAPQESASIQDQKQPSQDQEKPVEDPSSSASPSSSAPEESQSSNSPQNLKKEYSSKSLKSSQANSWRTIREDGSALARSAHAHLPQVSATMKGRHSFTVPGDVTFKVKFEDANNEEKNLKIDPHQPVLELVKAARVTQMSLFHKMNKTFGGMEDYFLWCEDTNRWLDNEMSLASYQISENQTLTFKNQIQLTVVVREVQVPLNISSGATVRDAIALLAKEPIVIAKQINFDSCGIYFKGVIVDETKPLLAAGIRPGDRVELRNIFKPTRAENMSGICDDTSVAIVVESAVHGIAKLFSFSLDVTVGDVCRAFLDKHPVKNPKSYSILKVNRSADKESDPTREKRVRKREEQLGVWLDQNNKLRDCKIQPMDVFLIKQRNTEKRQSMGLKKKRQTFGVDPSTLEIVEDAGFKVPKALVMLKQNLVLANGLTEEGIFRVAGSESGMKDIKAELNAETFKGSKQVFDLATLIKRFFCELPERIFDCMSPDVLGTAAESVEEAITVPARLPPAERELFDWLMDLFVETARHEEINKMNPRNIAIVAAPSLIKIPDGMDPIESLVITQQVSAIVELVIAHRLKTLGMQPTYDLNDIASARQALANSDEDEEISRRTDVERIHAESEKQGYIFRESQGIMKELKRSWFILSGNFLYYFNSRQEKEPSGAIYLVGATVRLLKSTSKKFPFLLYTRSKTHELFTTTSASANEWIQVIQAKASSRISSTGAGSLLEPLKEEASLNTAAKIPAPTGEVAKEGVMYKKGGARSWQKRYFFLKDNTLYWHVTKQDVIPVGSVNVLTCLIKPSSDHEKDKSKKFYYDLVTPVKTYHLYTEAKNERDQWVEALKNAQVKFSGNNVAAYQTPSLPTIHQANFKRQHSATNAPLRKDVKKERQQQLDDAMRQHPDLVLLIMNTPHFQATYQRQVHLLVEGKGNVSCNGIIDYWQRMRLRKSDLDDELRANLLSMIEVMATEKLYGEFKNLQIKYYETDSLTPKDFMHEFNSHIVAYKAGK